MPELILFISKYKIPWIVKWQYQLMKNPIIEQWVQTSQTSQALVKHHSQFDLVTRQFFVKWWDKFEYNRIISQVQR